MAVGAILATSAGVAASSGAPIHGALAAFAIASQTVPAQLLTGTDDRVWFVNASSELGAVQAGNATLNGVTLPSGSEFGNPTPAVLAAAGPEGEWSFASTLAASPATDSCAVTLVKPGGALVHVHLPSSLSDFYCTAGAADDSGSVWLGMVSGRYLSACHCRVSMVVQVTTAGQVTLYPPVREGARPQAVVRGADGAIWVLEGYDIESLGRYTSGASPSAVALPYGGWTDLLARPDGSFWLLRVLFCSGLNVPQCPDVALTTATGSVSSRHIYPVSRPSGASLQLDTTVGPDGSLWTAGRQSTGPNRLFRMDVNGQIDRSAGLTAPGGASLLADGPITMTATGTVWASAAAGSNDYLVRYRVA